ncbi:MAG TPA: OstA-like protein [Puia sp.]|nr:OstA-like protein [Puia sp.]
MRQFLFLFTISLFISANLFSQGQVAFKGNGKDSVRLIRIINADNYRYKKIDSSTELIFLTGHVHLKQDNTDFFCDSMVVNQKMNYLEAFGNAKIADTNKNNTTTSNVTNINSQYLKYLVDKKYVYFNKDVKLFDGKNSLFTNDLQYDLNQKVGIYEDGGKVVTDSSVLTSKSGTYFEDTKDIYFRRDVVMNDPQTHLTADSLLYNTESKLATFISPTFIKDSAGNVTYTKDGNYDMKNRRAHLTKRPIINNGAQRITGDDVQFDDSTGMSIATGNAVFIDTLQGVTVIGNYLISNRKQNTFLATQKPILILKQETDSIYIAADTFFSSRLKDSVITDSAAGEKDTLKNITTINTQKDNDTNRRFIQGFHHVRIFSDSLQAVADSLYYSGKDSVFQLFINPVVWANEDQITGDTIYLFTKNKKPKRLYVFENALAVDKYGNNMFNQIKGKTINGYFTDGVLETMRAKGNAESIYYATDDNKALVGINKVTKSDVIDMYFVDRKLNRVVLRNDVEGVMLPVRGNDPDELKLRNFKWLEKRRPRSKSELFE